MNKSAIFKAAHKLAKAAHVAGECYRVTFGASLRIVIAESKAPVPTTLEAIKAKFSVNAWNDRFYINLPVNSRMRGDSTIKVFIKNETLEISSSKGTCSSEFLAALDALIETIEANGGVKVRGYSSPFDRTYTINVNSK